MNSLDYQQNNAILANYQEDNFDTKKCSLHLLLRENIFKYCIIGPNNAVKVIRSLHLKNDLKQVISQENWLNQSFHKVRASIYDSSRTLIPSEFFDFNELATLYGKKIPNNSATLLYDYIDKLNHYNIYQINQELFELIREKYPKSLFQCGTSIWINSLIEENLYNVDPKMYISIGAQYLEIAILRGRELSFSGSFLCKTPEDLLYYILISAKEQQLDLAEDEFILLDNFDETSIVTLLQNYVTKIQIGYPPEKHDLPNELRLEKLCHHYDLLAI